LGGGAPGAVLLPVSPDDLVPELSGLAVEPCVDDTIPESSLAKAEAIGFLS
jgi:hypothetical protein